MKAFEVFNGYPLGCQSGKLMQLMPSFPAGVELGPSSQIATEEKRDQPHILKGLLMLSLESNKKDKKKKKN